MRTQKSRGLEPPAGRSQSVDHSESITVSLQTCCFAFSFHSLCLMLPRFIRPSGVLPWGAVIPLPNLPDRQSRLSHARIVSGHSTAQPTHPHSHLPSILPLKVLPMNRPIPGSVTYPGRGAGEARGSALLGSEVGETCLFPVPGILLASWDPRGPGG